MALPINPRITETLKKTAGARAGLAVMQRLSPQQVRNAQRIIQVGNFIGGVLGTGTGIDAVDRVLGIGGPVEEQSSPLLGGLALKDARTVMEQLRAARLAQKNLFYLSVSDLNPPGYGYFNEGGGISAPAMFNLFAVDVSYSEFTMTGEKVNVGSAVVDKLTGSEAVELSVTTMDDERGTLKRWFKAKHEQAAHPDGTFGLPFEYCVQIEVVHAIPSRDSPNEHLAYRSHMLMRPQSIQVDLSRRDQAMQEIQMSFSQFDTFVGGF